MRARERAIRAIRYGAERDFRATEEIEAVVTEMAIALKLLDPFE
jgi:hypothetical protein